MLRLGSLVGIFDFNLFEAVEIYGNAGAASGGRLAFGRAIFLFVMEVFAGGAVGILCAFVGEGVGKGRFDEVVLDLQEDGLHFPAFILKVMLFKQFILAGHSHYNIMTIYPLCLTY